MEVIDQRWVIPGLILLLLLNVATQSEAQSGCGKRLLGATALVSNGYVANKGDWPWHVALFRREHPKPEYKCGGSIISKHFVVTAAHCFEGSDPDKYFFKAGVHHLYNDTDINVVTYNLSEIILHPKFNRGTLYDDIALMRPDSHISFVHDYVSPICLGPKPGTQALADGIVAGFGYTEADTISQQLQQTKIIVLSRRDCQSKLTDSTRYLAQDEGKFCGEGEKAGSNVCKGDSGGGYYVAQDKTKEEGVVWYLQGLVSAAPRKDSVKGALPCNADRPAVYTDVTKYVGWIAAHEKIINEHNLLKEPDCGVVAHADASDEAGRPVFNQYPWNVLLEFKQLKKGSIHLICSGVLVHRRFVLTVGHCTDGILNKYKLMSVRLGEFNVQSTEDSDPSAPNVKTITQTVDVDTVIPHPSLNNPLYSNDLALVKLKHDAYTSKVNIKPICLPSMDDYKEASLTLTGWKRNKVAFPRLERDSMNISSLNECKEHYGKLDLNLPISEDVLCAIYNDRPKSRCKNYATGSPMQYIKTVDKKPHYFLAGLMVFSLPYCRLNGAEMFVHLSNATEWIQRTVLQ